LKSGSLKLLEPSGPLQACNRIAVEGREHFKQLGISGKIIQKIGFIGRVFAGCDVDLITPDRTKCRTVIDLEILYK
jgi:hypothetical protein